LHPLLLDGVEKLILNRLHPGDREGKMERGEIERQRTSSLGVCVCVCVCVCLCVSYLKSMLPRVARKRVNSMSAVRQRAEEEEEEEEEGEWESVCMSVVSILETHHNSKVFINICSPRQAIQWYSMRDSCMCMCLVCMTYILCILHTASVCIHVWLDFFSHHTCKNKIHHADTHNIIHQAHTWHIYSARPHSTQHTCMYRTRVCSKDTYIRVCVLQYVSVCMHLCM
jgi:hypothetical protein